MRRIKGLEYLQANCIDVNYARKKVVCRTDALKEVTVDYEKLVIACGAVSNTFGIPGVPKHAFFLKDISDARRIRHRVLNCFEKASLLNSNNTNSISSEGLLRFAIVGGGPTGIEFAAELHDFVKQDLTGLYPKLIEKCRIDVYDISPRILSSFDASLGEYTRAKFTRDGINIHTRISHLLN